MQHEPDWDAQTLAEAKVITQDPSRLEAAKQAAVKIAEREAEKVRAMKSVARSPRPRSTSVKKSSSPLLGGSY